MEARLDDSASFTGGLKNSSTDFNSNMGKYEHDADWEINPKNIELKEAVGSGTSGTVHRALWLGSTVAVKVIKSLDDAGLAGFRAELNMLQRLHHPHTVQFLGAVTLSRPYMIVAEFIAGGSLADLFERCPSPGPNSPGVKRALEIAHDINRGMTYLHSRRIVHRDLKPGNVLLGGAHYDVSDYSLSRKRAAFTGIAKVADFGLSKNLTRVPTAVQGELAGQTLAALPPTQVAELSQHGSRMGQMLSETFALTAETGSYRYMAPEVFRHEAYNHKVDVYAYAIVCFELFDGSCPYGTMHPVQAAYLAATQGLRPTWTNHPKRKVPECLKRVVERCWDGDHTRRPDFAEIYKEMYAICDTVPHDGPNVWRADSSSIPGRQGCCSIS